MSGQSISLPRYLIQKCLYKWKRGPNRDIMPGHLADTEKILGLCKRRQLPDPFIQRFQIFLPQILRQISPQDKIRIIDQMEQVHRLRQIVKKSVPPFQEGRLLSSDPFKKFIRTFRAS